MQQMQKQMQEQIQEQMQEQRAVNKSMEIRMASLELSAATARVDQLVSMSKVIVRKGAYLHC